MLKMSTNVAVVCFANGLTFHGEFPVCLRIHFALCFLAFFHETSIADSNKGKLA